MRYTLHSEHLARRVISQHLLKNTDPDPAQLFDSQRRLQLCILIILFGHPISEPLLFGEFPHFMSLQGHCCPPAIVDTGSDRNKSS